MRWMVLVALLVVGCGGRARPSTLEVDYARRGERKFREYREGNQFVIGDALSYYEAAIAAAAAAGRELPPEVLAAREEVADEFVKKELWYHELVSQDPGGSISQVRKLLATQGFGSPEREAEIEAALERLLRKFPDATPPSGPRADRRLLTDAGELAKSNDELDEIKGRGQSSDDRFQRFFLAGALGGLDVEGQVTRPPFADVNATGGFGMAVHLAMFWKSIELSGWGAANPGDVEATGGGGQLVLLGLAKSTIGLGLGYSSFSFKNGARRGGTDGMYVPIVVRLALPPVGMFDLNVPLNLSALNGPGPTAEEVCPDPNVARCDDATQHLIPITGRLTVPIWRGLYLAGTGGFAYGASRRGVFTGSIGYRATLIVLP